MALAASGRQGNDLETFGPFPAKLAPPKFNFTNALFGVQDNRNNKNCAIVDSRNPNLVYRHHVFQRAPR